MTKSDRWPWERVKKGALELLQRMEQGSRGEARDKKERQEGEPRPWQGGEWESGLSRSRAQAAPIHPHARAPRDRLLS